MKTKEIREKRGAIVKEMNAIHELAAKEARAMSAEEEVRFDKLDSDQEKLKADLEREERMEGLNAEMAKRAFEKEEKQEERKDDGKEKEIEKRAFSNFLRHGILSITPEERAFVEKRAQTTQTGSSGGYLVPEGFMNDLEAALLSYGGIFKAATILRTASGNDLPWPTSNDTTVEGEQIDENTEVAAADVAYGVILFKAWLYSSKMIKVPITLMQDSAFNLDNHLATVIAHRLNRIISKKCTIGVGTTEPKGIVVASTLGVTAVTAATVSYDNLVDLFHSVDPDYRLNASWMFNDTVLKALKKLKDDENRPIWGAGLNAGESDSIMGKPFTINQQMANMGASAKPILFGDVSKYQIRLVMDLSVLRLAERFADFGQIGYLGFMRADGNLVDAGTHPIKYLANAAS